MQCLSYEKSNSYKRVLKELWLKLRRKACAIVVATREPAATEKNVILEAV